MHTRAVFVGLLLFALSVSHAPNAEAGATIEGCAKIAHANDASPTSQNQWRASYDSLATTAACAAQTHQLVDGECKSFNLRYRVDGAVPPGAPNEHALYWFYGSDTQDDHGTTGEDNWDEAIWTRLTSGVPAATESVELCATSNGERTGDAKGGTYRLVLRLCDNACTSTTGYDVNSDVNPDCACQGNDGVGFTATANPATLTVPDVEEDPLWVHVPETVVLVGSSVNFTITAEFLNGTMRSGAASNITVHIKAPDQTWPVDGANPTEMKLPDNAGSQYHYTFTASQAGEYRLVVKTVSSLNEIRLAKGDLIVTAKSAADMLPTRGYLDALEDRLNDTLANHNDYTNTRVNATSSASDALLLDVQDYLATLGNTTSAADQLLMLAVQNYLATNQNSTTAPLATTTLVLAVQNYLALDDNATHSDISADLVTILENIQDANNTSSGALSYATWNLWRAGEWRDLTNTTNGTARETSITLLRNSTDGASNGIYARLDRMENSTLSAWLGSQWQTAKPTSRDHALILIGAVGLVTGGVARGRHDRKEGATILLGGIVLAVIYFVTM